MNEIELVEAIQMHTVTDKKGERHLLSVPITMHVTAAKKAEIGAAKLVAIKWNGEIVATISEAMHEFISLLSSVALRYLVKLSVISRRNKAFP